MDFKQQIDNIARYGNKYGFYVVAFPVVRPGFEHTAKQLFVYNDACGGALAVTIGGKWYPFYPEKAGNKFPDGISGDAGAWVGACGDWKDACIDGLNPPDSLHQEAHRKYANRLRDPFIADVNETLLLHLKKQEAGEE